MARVNVYLPDDLADEARAAGLNVSGITQEALRAELEARRSSAWLVGLRSRGGAQVSRKRVVEVLDAVRSEGGDHWPDAAER